MDLQKVGRFIAERRKIKNLTQEKLGELLDVTDSTISKWERGVNAPDISVLNKLSDILDVSVREILNGCKKEENSQPEEDNTLQNIEYYAKLTKLKYVKISSYIIVGMLMLFAILFTINNYNRFRVYSISSKNNKYTLEGYIIYNQERNLTIIKNIDIQDDLIGTDQEERVKAIKVSITSDNKNIMSVFNESMVEKETINSFLLNETYFINEDLKSKEYLLSENVKLNNLNLEIKYVDKNDIEKTIDIPLNVKMEYSNNKLFY